MAPPKLPAGRRPSRSIRGAFALVLCAFALGLGAVLLIVNLGGSRSGAARQASEHTVYVSLGGQDGSGCGGAQSPCGSFDAAYRAAAPGAEILIESGTYPAQTVAADGVKASQAPVVFMPAPGASVRVAGPTHLFASHLRIENIHVLDVVIGNYDQSPGRPNPTDVTLRDVVGRDFEIDSATDVRISGGSWGPTSACGGPYGGGNNSIRDITGVDPANIVIDGVTVHDVQSYDLMRCHIEGLAIFAGRNVRVSNSKFYGNSVYDVFVQPNSGPISGLTFKGDWMAMPVGTNGTENGTVIGFSGVHANVLVADNRFNYIISLDDDGANPHYSDFRLIKNVGLLPYLGCTLKGITWSANIWRNGACSASDIDLKGGALPYRNPVNTSALDYALTAHPPGV